MKVPPALNKKVAGVPVIAWVGIFAVGIAVAIWLRKRNDAVQDEGFASPTEFATGPAMDVGSSMGGDFPLPEVGSDGLFDLMDTLEAGLDSLGETISQGFSDVYEGQAQGQEQALGIMDSITGAIEGSQDQLTGILDSMNETQKPPVVNVIIKKGPKGKGGKGGNGKGKNTKPKGDKGGKGKGKGKGPILTGGGMVQGNPAQRIDVANIINRTRVYQVPAGKQQGKLTPAVSSLVRGATNRATPIRPTVPTRHPPQRPNVIRHPVNNGIPRR